MTVGKRGYRGKDGGLSAKEVAVLLLGRTNLFFYPLRVSNWRPVN